MPLALAACGFAPAYGPNGSAAGLQGRIRIADPDTKNGFDLVSRLEERLGRAEAPRFDLTYTITTIPIGVGITPENAHLYMDDVDGFMVATGINRPGDFYNIDPARLGALLDLTRAYGAPK